MIRAIGDKLTCIFVDNGVLRHDEASQIRKRYERLQLPLVFVDALLQAAPWSSTAPLRPRTAAGADTSGNRRARSPGISPWMRTAPPGSRKSSARAPSQSTLNSQSRSSNGSAQGTDASIGMYPGSRGGVGERNGRGSNAARAARDKPALPATRGSRSLRTPGAVGPVPATRRRRPRIPRRPGSRPGATSPPRPRP